MKKFVYKRRIYLINKPFQFKYLFVILAVMLVTVFTVGFTTFYIIWNSVIDEFMFVPEASKKMGDIFANTTAFLIIPVLLLAGIFSLMGILLSHKIAGPIYRVERVAEELAKGNLDISVRFRKGDDLKHLADSLNEMIEGMRKNVRNEKKIISSIDLIAEKLHDDVLKEKGLKKNVKASIKKLNEIVKKLKKSTDRYRV